MGQLRQVPHPTLWSQLENLTMLWNTYSSFFGDICCPNVGTLATKTSATQSWKSESVPLKIKELWLLKTKSQWKSSISLKQPIGQSTTRSGNGPKSWKLWLLFKGYKWKNPEEKRLSHTNAANATMYLPGKAIWKHIWKLTVEKCQANATNVTMPPLGQALWGNI